jgi:hypothetical protein
MEGVAAETSTSLSLVNNLASFIQSGGVSCGLSSLSGA